MIEVTWFIMCKHCKHVSGAHAKSQDPPYCQVPAHGSEAISQSLQGLREYCTCPGYEPDPDDLMAQ